MAKQAVISALEEVFGEYVLNFSKENLRIAALRGKIKLENVQLDGEVLGSMILGAVGLEGFGILSCSSESVKISVPWGNLEKEPTKFEIKGVHLVCVPLMPSTAHKLYGGGTQTDPRCTLRTRAKRLALSRMERLFWTGQIPGEGPVMKKIQRAVREVERDQKRKKDSRKKKNSQSVMSVDDENHQASSTAAADGKDIEETFESLLGTEDLPELPRDWKVKLREKVLRNLVASMEFVHIRCEVPEGGLEFVPKALRPSSSKDRAPAEERAFAFGFTVENFLVRTANEDWKVGSHDTKNPLDGSTMSSVKGHLGPNEYVVKNNKIGFFHKFSMYWDDEPPVLLSETDILKGNYRKLSPEKLQIRIAAAMKSMFSKQEPGEEIRQSLGFASNLSVEQLDLQKPHEYITENFEAEVRVRTSDREIPGPVSCSADVLPFVWTLNIRHHQYVQYRQLQNAMKSQQRFDTMLRQRPKLSPKEDPRGWWQYAVACVTSRPNSRPWSDVKVIVQNRSRYMELVVKKNLKKTDANGYHAGLSESESTELLALEELLPIEAMKAFHLLALRRAHLLKTNPELMDQVKDKQRKSRVGLGRFRFSSSKRRSDSLEDPSTSTTFTARNLNESQHSESSFTNLGAEEDSKEMTGSASLLEAMTLRLGNKIWFVDWRLHDATWNVVLASPIDGSSIAHFVIRSSGNIRAFGRGKRDFCFDISQCEMMHHEETVLFVRPSRDDVLTEADSVDNLDETLGSLVPKIPATPRLTSSNDGLPNLRYSSGFLDLPPEGVICRVAHGKNGPNRNYSVSCHPVNLIWKGSLLDELLEFFVRQAKEVKSDLALYVRNAATPLARKAQLALISPGSFAVHLNVASPKVWLPVSPKSGNGGVLLLDAGAVRVAGNKGEGDSAMAWELRGKSIQARYTKGRVYDAYMGFISPSFSDTLVRSEATVISPFNISVDASNEIEGEKELASEKGLVRAIDVTVSPVCLNLVDAEVLARSFGKWYVKSIRRANRRAADRNASVAVTTVVAPTKDKHMDEHENKASPVRLSVKIEKIELALEGHSKAVTDDDRSFTSLDSAYEASPLVRTYLVEISEVDIFRQKQSHLSTTSLTVSEASILRMRDGSQYAPLKSRLDVVDAQYRVLVRSTTPSSHDKNVETTPAPPIIRASLLHDGYSHLDEAEVDIDSVILRVTPTTLKDCAKAFRRIAEFTQVATKEMERKVHEEGRKARRRGSAVARDEMPDNPNDSFGRSPSPTASLVTDFSASGRRSPKLHSDSSILLRLVVKESTILAGRPTLPVSPHPSILEQVSSYAVIQLLSNALIMFQSIENPDGSGSKTLHLSIDNASALVHTDFERIPLSSAAPMIGPTGAELRVVYATENLGCVVSQDISADCEELKACMTPNDLSTMSNISRTMVDRMKLFGEAYGERRKSRQRLRALSNLIRYQKKGTGIATSVRAQVQSVSFVLLQVYKSHIGSPEFLDFRLEQVKMTLEGCLSALSGECNTTLSVNLLNSDSATWEYAVEPFPLSVSVDQMPDEIILELVSMSKMRINLTGILLRDFAEMKFDFHQGRSTAGKRHLDELSPSVLSTIGLRRATETPSIQITNITGFDVHVVPDSTAFSPESGLILNGKTLKTEYERRDREGLTFSLRVAPSATDMIGERDSVYDLPIETISADLPKLYLLKPSRSGLAHLQLLIDGRSSPETVHTEATLKGPLALTAEPIVEFCMHNQRLRSSVGDVFGLPKGSDLLSSILWSPEDEEHDDCAATIDHGFGQELAIDSTSGPEIAAGVQSPEPLSPSRFDRNQAPKQNQNNWLRPYLKNDSPEWTDMTCTLRMARERVMLPDSNWIWVNDWTVDLSGNLGESTDADGWEYQTDFETFSRSSRDYTRGDTCRRRRWTRTRIIRPPSLHDPSRLLKFVWDKSVDPHGNICVTIRSNVRIKNKTSLPLSFFVSGPAWDGDYYVGSAELGDTVNVPVILAAAVYLKIGRKTGVTDPVSPNDCICTNNIMIIPNGHSSSNFVRTSMNLEDVSGTVLHFLVEIQSRNGIVDIIVEPVLRVVNLLPCLIDCQLGEVIRPGDGKVPDARKAFGSNAAKKVAKTEVMKISSGEEASFTAVSPWKKPHISLRVPGYQWSLWYRIVNRKASTETWRPSEDEEAIYVNSKDDADFAGEFKSSIRFDRSTTVGDPLSVILSVECGHCPTLRVYSQYWVLDKTGFGCRFADGFEDMLNRIPDRETSRRSHLLHEETQDSFFRKDMKLPGHQWSIGSGGMSLYYSKREKLTISIESLGKSEASRKGKGTLTNWISPIDISNVMPKTVFSLDEIGGSRTFDLAVSVNVCPGIFSRTKLITLLPRYQVVNLLNRELIIAQDGCLQSAKVIPSKAAIPFHWEKGNLPPKVRIGAPRTEQRHKGDFQSCWSNGRIRLDRVGITSMRLPTDNNLSTTPMVVQVEVRLATKDQPTAVEVVIWSATEKSNNLYMLRNRSRHTILCRQPLQEEQSEAENTTANDTLFLVDGCTPRTPHVFHCGTEIGPTIRSFLGLDRIEEFVWVLKSGEVASFGFDDPEKPHILEWSCVDPHDSVNFNDRCRKAVLEVDAMGSSSTLSLSLGRQVQCQIAAEHSTKVIEFSDINDHKNIDGPMESHVRELRRKGIAYEKRILEEGMISPELVESLDEDEDAAFGLRLSLPGVSVSVVDNGNPKIHGREILLASFEKIYTSFSQSREGYHEFELRLMSFQVDNFVQKSIHPVLISCPPLHEGEPLLHMSAVRRLQLHSDTFVFRYAALRLLKVDIFLDRMTAETIARFLEPFTRKKEEDFKEPGDWVDRLTTEMEVLTHARIQVAPANIQSTIHSANSGRIYFEQLHLHPVRLSFTFTQEWMEWSPSSQSSMLVQFIRGMASIANAPLTFTSFIVSHVFEAPQALGRVIGTHYSSQLTKQIFAILGSLAIFGAPADFITNVGTGVRDFFYEPINGAVHGPKQFIEGLEAGTQSLARGVFVGVVRGAANVTELVNANLVGLTADDDFIDERKAHQRLLTDAMSRGTVNRTLGDSLILAGASVARGVKSGALGIVEQPAIYASKHGPFGFLKGVGKAIVGALVKPVVGVGDAAVLVMNHVSDATDKSRAPPRIPKRLRRALPSQWSDKPNCVRLVPYDERAAKAQKIVTGGDSLDDVYIGHIHIPSHLIITSDQCFWAIDRRSRDPWCVNWEEISHFSRIDGGIRVLVFSKTGLKTYVFHVEGQEQANELHKLLLMHAHKMGNPSDLVGAEPQQVSRHHIPGMRSRQVNHVFGSCNDDRIIRPHASDEIDLVEQCFDRVQNMSSESQTFFKNLDEEAWGLIMSWRHVFSGLSSKRCIVAGIINGTGSAIQVKSTKLVEGGSPCYTIPTREYDPEQGLLSAGGAILLFGWGNVPNLLNPGSVFMQVETNGFICHLGGQKSRDTYAEAMPGCQVGFLEKSFDDNGWWAKYWLLVTSTS